jgi:NAD(P)H-hydrate epimerase
MSTLHKGQIKSILKQREPVSNKSNYGHALLIAGKKGYMGTAVIASRAALRAGCGLLTVCVPADERVILQQAIPEAMLLMREGGPLSFDKFPALGIGPGIGTDESAEQLLIEVISQFKGLLLLDADALTIISHNQKLFNALPPNTILTPHTGEFDRMFGTHENNETRIKTAVQKAVEHQIIIVLKGYQTAIVTPDEVFYNSTGNAGLSKGGSGDALTGTITSFLAQGYSPVNAVQLGVYLHGLAADLTLESQSMESMLITDVIENFGKAFNRIRS